MLKLEEQQAAQKQIAMKVIRDAEAEIRERFPKRSGHWRRKEAKKLAERRMADIARAGEQEKQISALTGQRARIVID